MSIIIPKEKKNTPKKKQPTNHPPNNPSSLKSTSAEKNLK